MSRLIVLDHLNKCGERTKEKIRWLIDLEKRAFTLNTHYYRDYRDNFLAFYRGCRERGSNDDTAIRNLQNYRPPNPYETSGNSANASIARILSNLPHVGFRGTTAADLAQLLPRDSTEPALIIMADVRAYFQGQCFTIDI